FWRTGDQQWAPVQLLSLGLPNRASSSWWINDRTEYMGAFLEQIEPLKQAALADLRAAPDLAALEQSRVNYLGSHGKFTALMKQLGGLSKEEKPAAGKAINLAKAELESALAARRGELELTAALPKEPTDFTLPGRRRLLGKLHPLTQV